MYTALTICAITLSVYLGVLGSQFTFRFIAERQNTKRQAQALAAFAKALDGACDDPDCEVHGTKAKEPALKN